MARSCPRGRCPRSVCPGALLHVSGTLLGSLPLKLWPGRGLPGSQSWGPILRHRALHPQTHEHLLAWRLGVPWCQASPDGERTPPGPALAVTSPSVPGLGAGQLEGEGGTSGPSCAQATPTHSAPLPSSRLVRAWASLCLWRRELRGQRETGVGEGGRARTFLGGSQPARLPPGLRFSVLSRRHGSSRCCLVYQAGPRPALCVPGSGDLGYPGPWQPGPPTQAHAGPSRGPHGGVSPWALDPQPHAP